MCRIGQNFLLIHFIYFAKILPCPLTIMCRKANVLLSMMLTLVGMSESQKSAYKNLHVPIIMKFQGS